MTLGELSQKDEEHWQMPFIDITKKLTIYATQSSTEKVFDHHHGLFRRKATDKPFLTRNHIEAHLAFVHIALKAARGHIVFTDSM